MESKLRDHLASHLSMTAVYPMYRQIETLPALVYERTNTDIVHTSDKPEDLTRADITIYACATTYAGSRALADRVSNLLDGYRGQLGISNTLFVTSLWTGENDSYEPAQDGSSKGIFVNERDYEIWYARVLPSYT